MQFNFVLSNHKSAALQELDDILRPLFVGLRTSGHHVVAGATRFQKSPAINVIADGAASPDFLDAIHAARTAWAGEFRLGMLRVRSAIQAPDLLPVDFLWTLGPGETPDVVAQRTAVVTYGFDEALVGPRLISNPALRTLDVVVYGAEGEWLTRVSAPIEAAGLGCFVIRPGALPDYLVTDLVSRAKIVAVIGDPADPPAALAPRVLKALCNGVVVAAEPPPSGRGVLWELVVQASPDMLAAACRGIIAEGRYVERGRAALDQLRATWTMCDGVRDALALVGGAAEPG